MPEELGAAAMLREVAATLEGNRELAVTQKLRRKATHVETRLNEIVTRARNDSLQEIHLRVEIAVQMRKNLRIYWDILEENMQIY